jgi:hypothetical protein
LRRKCLYIYFSPEWEHRQVPGTAADTKRSFNVCETNSNNFPHLPLPFPSAPSSSCRIHLQWRPLQFWQGKRNRRIALRGEGGRSQGCVSFLQILGSATGDRYKNLRKRV